MKFALLTLALLASGSSAAFAQPISGGELRPPPPPPSQPQSVPDIRIERGGPRPDVEIGGPRIVVRAVRVTGATRFTEAELVAASGFQPGAEMDLAGLRGLAGRISDFYNRRGYFVAQAYLPAQGVQDGVVTIAVIEGRYGKIGLNNQTNVSDGLARSVLAGLEPGDLVATPPLERRLLLLSDLPGVTATSRLTPGEAVGSSDLLVDLAPGRRISGNVQADNGGNRYTGQYRAGGTIAFNEPTGHGDVASLRVLSSGSGLNYVRGAYQARIQDATVGVAYEHLAYKLGREFAPLDASGTVDIASAYGSYPLIRSRNANLYATAEYDARWYTDKVRVVSSVDDKTAHVAILGLSGDRHDMLWGGGWSSGTINWSLGQLRIKNPILRALDAQTARSNGGYNKLAFEAARLQSVGGGPLTLYGEARGQLASKNLDTSEKMELGGAYGVRAYPEGEAYGDQGYILTAEGRLRLAGLSEATHGNLQAVAFVDHGQTTLDKSPWTAGSNHRSLSAAGVGLTWSDRHDLLVKVSYAFKLGSERATSAPDRSGRLWVQVSKSF